VAVLDPESVAARQARARHRAQRRLRAAGLRLRFALERHVGITSYAFANVAKKLEACAAPAAGRPPEEAAARSSVARSARAAT
jgi:hypothetical protein